MTAKIKSPERLVFFSDAVVAIALTLLILPLADVVKDYGTRGAKLDTNNSYNLIASHLPLIYAFLLSFVVIIRFWFSHHRIFEHVRAYSTPLLIVNMLWVLSIVFLPFPTEMVANFGGGDRLTHIVYGGNLFMSSVLLTTLVWIIRRDPEVRREGDETFSDRRWFDAVTTSGSIGVATLLMAIFPSWSYYPLLLGVLQPQLVRLRFRSH
ncbi:MAG TPA: TMEM175 family protein [Pseudonocardiaceae bacterium]|nr:TMEM175 family protein [Pseudonocardiaceae bacterium]